jgi:hypothetical protein
MKMGHIGCPETSVKNYNYPLCNNPEKPSSHQLRGESLQSRKTTATWPDLLYLLKVDVEIHCCIGSLNSFHKIFYGLKIWIISWNENFSKHAIKMVGAAMSGILNRMI